MNEVKQIRKRRAKKPDAQGFDEVRIFTVPRYKSSGLSGSEWRISGKCELLRKGKVIHEFSMADVENCAKALPAQIMQAHDEAKFYFAGEGDLCDQEGCSEKATTTYRIKNEYCNEPHRHGPTEIKDEIVYRMFCERHSKRGDCSFDDSDDNYSIMEGFVVEPRPEDVKESAFGGIIEV